MNSLPNQQRSPIRQRPWLLFAVAGTLGLVIAACCCAERTRWLLFQSAQLALSSAAMAIPTGVLLAWLLVRTDLPARRLLLWVLLACVTIPLYLQAAAWDAGFGQQGWWQQVAAGISTRPLLSGMRAAVWVHAVAAIPWVVLIVAAEFWRAPQELEDAALLDGTPGQIAVTLSLPQIAGAALASLLWIVITVANEISVTDLYQVRTYTEELYVGFALDPVEDTTALQPAVVGVLPGVLLLGWLMLAALLVGWKLWPYRDENLQWTAPRIFPLRRWRWPGLLLLCLVLLVLIGVPLLNLLYKVGVTVDQVGDQRLRGWSMAKAVRLCCMAPWRFGEELGWSLVLAQTSSLLAVLMAFLLGWWSRRARLVRISAILVAAVLFAVPGPSLALWVIHFFQTTDSNWLAYLYSNSLAAPLIVLSLKAFPIVFLLIMNGLRRVPTGALEAARLAGAGDWRQLIFIVLPQQLHLLVAAWLVGMIIGLGDVAASILTVPPGVTTIAICIFALMHYGVEDQLAAICLFMVAATIAVTLLAALVGRRYYTAVRQ